MFIKYWKVIKILTINNFKSQFQYKFNIGARFISGVVELLINIVFLNIIFHHTHKIINWAYPEILILIFTFDFIKSLLNGLFVKNLSKIEDILVNGKFDYYLTKPIDIQFYTSIQQISIPHLIHALMPLILLIITIYHYNFSFSIFNIIAFIVSLVFGLLAVYSTWILVMSSCFYIIKIKAVHEVFLEIIQLGKYPKDIYHKFLRIALTTILPILLIASYPSELFLQKFSSFYLFILLLIPTSLFIISRYIWNYSIKKYESSGG